MNKIAIVTTTVDDEDMAKKLAHGIIESKLGACVQIIPGVRSMYQWKGELCKSDEFILQTKTGIEVVAELVKHLEGNHPYETPEILVQEVQSASDDYYVWVQGNIEP